MSSFNAHSLLLNGQPVDSVINGEDECGQTLLIRTIFSDDQSLRRKIFEALLQVRVNIWTLDSYGRNALMWACLFKRDYEIAKLLQYVNAIELLQADIYGNIALHLAVTSGSAAAVKLIVNSMIEHELSLDIENNSGITPKMIALRLGLDVCYSLLESVKSQPEQPDAGEEDSEYLHQRRQPVSAMCRSLTSLPPILPSNLTKKMKSYDIKACYQVDDENPSEFLKKVCWKKCEHSTQRNNSKGSRLPSLVSNSEQFFSSSSFSDLAESPYENEFRLPDIHN